MGSNAICLGIVSGDWVSQWGLDSRLWACLSLVFYSFTVCRCHLWHRVV